MDSEWNSVLEERYSLAYERISEIKEKEITGFPAAFGDYFKKTAVFVQSICRLYETLEISGGTEDLETLQKRNLALYYDILPEQYGESYANPVYAAEQLSLKYGRLLCVLYAELRTMIPFAYEADLKNLVIRMELFLEVYTAFSYALAENGKIPDSGEIADILGLYAMDYSTEEWEQRLYQQLNPEYGFFTKWILESDLTDLRYLYRTGEYITDSEYRTAEYLNSLPEEKISLMADTYTDGYCKGFEVTGKDISGRKSVNIVYRIGFERVVRRAIENFEKKGLKATVRRGISSLTCSGAGVNGHTPNRQYEFDHKSDAAPFLDKLYLNRKLEAARAGFEANRDAAAVYGGPAVIEVFGEEPFTPVQRKESCRFTEEQQKMLVEYKSRLFRIQSEYIREENRSFTIIAFPVPDIGEDFPRIFDEIIRINTLDYELYRSIQQKIIDTLDQADYVTVQGMNGNRTDLKICLHPIRDAVKETKFENCVADVNIPVGEVFTSPRLKGTDGILHVTKVFLNGLGYKNLELRFRDGWVTDSMCSNFKEKEENREFLKENLFYHHESLPMGEFAIGTNTMAYVTARKFNIEAKMPILIAEKTGPHFAVGDTCYSHAEEIPMYNPDGKEMIARENEVSLLRATDPGKAYLNCHTDITIPYDELGELAAWKPDGTKEVILKNGRFVLPGTEELNAPFSGKVTF